MWYRQFCRSRCEASDDYVTDVLAMVCTNCSLHHRRILPLRGIIEHRVQIVDRFGLGKLRGLLMPGPLVGLSIKLHAIVKLRRERVHIPAARSHPRSVSASIPLSAA